MGWKPPSVEEFNNDWITPKDSLGDVVGQYRRDAHRRWILDRLKSGVILAVARTRGQLGKKPEPFVLIDWSFWNQWDETGEFHFWEMGDATFEDSNDSTGYNTTQVHFLDIRFDPSTMGSTARPDAPEFSMEDRPALPPAIKNELQSLPYPVKEKAKGGANRKDWREDLWIEVVRRIRAGTLTGNTAASGSRLEYDLIDIAKEMGFSPGESTLKPMALKLFKYLNESGGK